MSSDTEISAGNQVPEPAVIPDPEVVPKAKARSFAPSYKKQILADLDGLDREGQATLLRREGLYAALIRRWRQQAARDAGIPVVVKKRRGPAPDPTARELAKAQREIEQLKKELATSRRINDVQAKLCALLDDL